MAGYNRTRAVEELLERTELLPPSFSVHLHPEYWTLNNGSKFLYNNQIASLLDDIRAHRIPVDFLDLFDNAKVPFYDGCMIVELLDYRPQRFKEATLEKPERTRAVLHPNSETLWADICLLNQKWGGKWSDSEALEIESRLLLATAPPLCLDPDPHLTRIANHILRVSTPTIPMSLKRKAAALDPEEDETDKARRAKIMQFMNPRPNRSHTPSYRILDAIQRTKVVGETRPPSVPPSAPTPSTNMAPPPIPYSMQYTQPSPASQSAPPNANFAQTNSPASSDSTAKKKLKQKQPQSQYSTGDRDSGTPTPAPQHQANQFQAQHHSQTSHHSPSPVSQSPMQQPHAFVNPHANGDLSNRAPTPAQRQFSQSPQVTSSQPLPTSQQSQQPQSQYQQTQAPPSITTNNFQPAVPNSNFLLQPPIARNAQAKSSPNPRSTPQPNPSSQPQNQTQAQMLYAHHIQQQANAQRLHAGQTHNGRATPQGLPPSRSPMNTGQVALPRGSPMAQTQPLASQSPMPSNTPQMSHPQHSQHHHFPPHHYPAHIRPGPAHGNQPAHPQGLSPHPPNGNGNSGVQVAAASVPSGQQQQSQSQEQTQAHPPPTVVYPQMPQMFSYAQLGMNMNFQMPPGRMPQGYAWPVGMSRGIPGVNGQAMPGMAPGSHPQQLPIGKAVPGGMPGR